MVGGYTMNKEEILRRYQNEKDEGKVFFESKALFKGFTMMMLIAMFLMIMAFLLSGDTIITDICFLLIIPFLFCFYGIKGYYTKNKTTIFISAVWIFLYIMRFIDIMKVLF